MEKIENWEDFRALKEIIKETKQNISNFYFLPAQIKESIAQGKLFTLPVSGGRIFLIEEPGFFRVYYYLKEDSRLAPLQLEKDAVIEFPFQGELAEKNKLEIDMISQLGFSLGRESSKMEMKISDYVPDAALVEAAAKSVEMAIEQDAEEVFKLLSVTFNPLFAFLPTLGDVASQIQEQRIFLIRGPERNIEGVLCSALEKRAAVLDQLVVAENSRGKGYGRALVTAYHEYYKSRVQQFSHWVDVHNSAAIALYSKLGYSFSARKANEYIKIKRR